jgi:TATA-box binding protein (TBP) (component of TFIID and TFIIIB)
MNDNLEEKNDKINVEKSEDKEDYINEISSKLRDEEEDEGQKINFGKIGNIEKINIPEIEDKKEEKKNEKLPQTDQITTTLHTTNLFKTTIVEKIPKINFVHCSANLHYEFEDLNKLEKRPEIIEIEKRGNKKDQAKKNKCFDRIKLLIEKPNKYAFLSKSGKVIYTGAKSINESISACFKVANIIKSWGYNIHLKKRDIKINNISGTYNLNFKIHLKNFHQQLLEYSKNNDIKVKKISKKSILKKCNQKLKESPKSYKDPDSFPGVELSYRKSKFCIKTFSSGKTTFGGAKTEEQINEEYKKLFPIYNKCKM